MVRRCSFPAIFCAVIVLFPLANARPQSGALSASAQTSHREAGNPEQTPLFKTQANLVLVDVVVTDKGKPVQGLSESQFHVLEDGKEQKITIFVEHRATDALQAAQAPQLPPGVYSSYPQYTVTSAANVLLLDALNTPLSDQKYVRQRMLRYLGAIPPGTQIAVFTLASRLRMITGFTTDAASIAKALGPGRGNARKSPVFDPDLDESLRNIAGIAQVVGASPLTVAEMKQYAADTASFEVDQRMQITMDAMQQLARYLSTIPGRKNLIWFSGSFPATIAPDYLQLDPTSAERDYLQMVKRTDELMTRARVAVYPVDARGLLNVPSTDAAEYRDSTTGEYMSNSAETTHTDDSGMISEMFSEHVTMDQIARDTGGKAFYNTNGIGEALGEAIENGSNYYTLGYVPENRNYKGAFRKIRVGIAGGHYDLQYRQGYFADTAEAEAKRLPTKIDPMVAAMQVGAPPLSQLLFEVRVLPRNDASVKDEPVSAGPAGQMAKSLKHARRYMVDYWIDPRSLDHKALPDGKQQTQLEMTEVVYDEEGIRVNYSDGGLTLTQTPQEVQHDLQAGLPMHEQIDLPPGKCYLRVGVHDLLNGRIGTAQIPVDTGK